MRAGESACLCRECGVVCEGQFNGCAAVWAAGPREVVLARSGPEALDVAPEPLAAAQTAHQSRERVVGWLQDSFEGLSAQMRVLSDAVNRQQQVLGDMTEAQAAAARLSELADVLPERIGQAVYEALSAHQPSHDPRPEAWGEDVMGELRRVNDRPPVEPTPIEVGDELAPQLMRERTIIDLTPMDTDSGTSAPRVVRSHLGSVASTVESPINRGGWQEKLRSLSTL
jgi:hypothetical protein